MKRLFVCFAASAVLFAGTSLMAFAAGDAATLYKSCQGCHGAQAEKVPMGVGEAMKGQSAEDLLKKMHGYKDGTFGGNKKAIMVNILKRLDDEQMKTLADHIATL